MDSQHYFSTPLENIRAAELRSRSQNEYHINARVPTRKEVATLEAKSLRTLLTNWMCHSATEIIPSKAQIYEVFSVLRQRDDYKDLKDLAQMCANYCAND